MDHIDPYVITKPVFKGQFISLKAFGFIFMGYPVVIEQKQYDRNALYFNVVFVFKDNQDAQVYEPVAKKLANYLIILEKEGSYLTIEETKSNIPDMV